MFDKIQVHSIWTVVEGKKEIAFASFEVAVAYADHLITIGRGVKVIDVKNSLIRVDPLVQVAWVDPQIETTASTRHRRTSDSS